MALKDLETKFIPIGEELYPFFIGINSTSLYCDLKGCNLTQYYNDILELTTGVANPSITRDILYCCFKEGSRREKKPFEFDRFWMGEQMDNIGAEGITILLQAIADSLPEAKEDETTEDDEVKKK